MKKGIGLGFLLALLPTSAGAYTINLDTEYVPDAWHFEIIERGAFSPLEKSFVQGTATPLDAASTLVSSNLRLEMGLGGNMSIQTSVPYSLKRTGDKQGMGPGNVSFGLSKKILPLEVGGWKSGVQIGMPGAYGIDSYTVGWDNAFTTALWTPKLLLSTNLNYRYPLKKGVAVEGEPDAYYFYGDRITYGLGIEYWPASWLTLGLETFGNLQGVSKANGVPLEQDGTPLSNHVVTVAPGFTLALGPAFALQGSFLMPVVRSGYVGASPSYTGLVSTILDF